ncbi:ABC transporter ATP-binding protein [Halarsenatibacter silvermanii]|uniref:Oligopeptide transport system ATP-binding protein n=1 Tax=Halarsenatibacter silvermanii TaxID=321763 RepID=A0A1G9N0S2_9FIRM|nr:oligopeptide/dipeptide ABC transporter ATP-binding protein [Halarsenatibacter silvermanii]SDL80130.1 oligopeptide transport system ATP-binding protein [Halarsenatibacter silvermanii]
MNLVEIKDLHVHFTKEAGVLDRILGKSSQKIYAVDGVTLKIPAKTTFGLVGESGCGKSTVANSLLQLVDPEAGEIIFEGENIIEADRQKTKQLRRRMQLIFQDPISSLNPRKTAEEILEAPFRIHPDLKKSVESLDEEIDRLFEMVDLSRQARHKFPHEFSTGQARRIGIARALSLRPDLLVCDEPTAGLDVSIKAAVINLMIRLQEELDLTYLWISHDLHVVKHISDRLGVMYLGKMMEKGDSDVIFREPLHPYTSALFRSSPGVESDEKENFVLEGEVPSPINPPPGCSFHPRCQHAMDVCRQQEPDLQKIDERLVACHLYD